MDSCCGLTNTRGTWGRGRQAVELRQTARTADPGRAQAGNQIGPMAIVDWDTEAYPAFEPVTRTEM